MALPQRLRSTCLSLSGSPKTVSGMARSTVASKSRFLAAAWGTNISATPSTTESGLNWVLDSSILPASIFEKSRMSLIMVRSDAPASRIVLTCSFDLGLRSPRSSTSTMPSMPFSGVLSSWLTLATNSDLILRADWAWSLAILSWVTKRRWVSISVQEPHQLKVAPLSSLIGKLRTRNQRYSPSKRFIRISISKSRKSVTQLCHVDTTCSRSSGCTRVSQSSCERSLLVRPQ